METFLCVRQQHEEMPGAIRPRPAESVVQTLQVNQSQMINPVPLFFLSFVYFLESNQKRNHQKVLTIYTYNYYEFVLTLLVFSSVDVIVLFPSYFDDFRLGVWTQF